VFGAAGLYAGAFIATFGGTAGISVLFGGVGAGLTAGGDVQLLSSVDP
jgi:hypothetical protein